MTQRERLSLSSRIRWVVLTPIAMFAGSALLAVFAGVWNDDVLSASAFGFLWPIEIAEVCCWLAPALKAVDSRTVYIMIMYAPVVLFYALMLAAMGGVVITGHRWCRNALVVLLVCWSLGVGGLYLFIRLVGAGLS